MALEGDAEQIPHLALIPVRCRPEINDAADGGEVALERDFEADVGVAVVGEEMIDHGEIAVRLALALRTDALVDGGEVVQHAVWAIRFGFQVAQSLAHMILRYPQRRNPIRRCLRCDNYLTELVLQFL